MLAPDIFEPLGSIRREQTRPNERIEEPLLTPAEEIAWRTRELASLRVGACYWYFKDRPYKARRIQILPPVDPPFHGRALHLRIDAAMAAQKGIQITTQPEPRVEHPLTRAIAERSARRNEAAGIDEPLTARGA